MCVVDHSESHEKIFGWCVLIRYQEHVSVLWDQRSVLGDQCVLIEDNIHVTIALDQR